MTSNNHVTFATPLPERSKSASAPPIVYVLSYDAKDWRNGVTLADGTKPKDEVHGTLASYRSLSHAQALSNAQDAAIEWGLQQLQRRLSTHDPPLETEKDRDAAFDKWAQSKSRQGDNWSYTISKDDEVLIVKAEMDDDQGSESDDGGTGGSKWKGN